MNSYLLIVGPHWRDVQRTSGPALAADEAKAETASAVPRSGPCRGITGHQSRPRSMHTNIDQVNLESGALRGQKLPC